MKTDAGFYELPKAVVGDADVFFIFYG